MNGRAVMVLAAVVCWGNLAPGNPLEPFFERHCFDCHSGQSPEAGLDLSAVSRDAGDSAARERLARIHDRIAKQEMPPRDYPQPAGDEANAVTTWLDTQLHAADMAAVAREGRAATRRLTNSEYENTLRDLLALPDLEVRGLLSADGKVDGYHKIGDGLDLSPVHLAAYTTAAETAISAAIATRSTPPPVIRRRIYPASVFRFNTTSRVAATYYSLTCSQTPHCHLCRHRMSQTDFQNMNSENFATSFTMTTRSPKATVPWEC